MSVGFIKCLNVCLVELTRAGSRRKAATDFVGKGLKAILVQTTLAFGIRRILRSSLLRLAGQERYGCLPGGFSTWAVLRC